MHFSISIQFLSISVSRLHQIIYLLEIDMMECQTFIENVKGSFLKRNGCLNGSHTIRCQLRLRMQVARYIMQDRS